MKKQDANGVRTATDIERKYKLQDIEKTEIQIKYALTDLQSKLDISQYEDDIAELEQVLEDDIALLEQAIEDALDDIMEATEEAIEQIQNELDDYMLISSEMTTQEIEDFLDNEGEEEEE